MEIKKLNLRGINCKECGDEIPRGDQHNKSNGGRYHLHCGRIKRLHVQSLRWVNMLYVTSNLT
jgi:hypothetical protein